jgi:hypothetical protein
LIKSTWQESQEDAEKTTLDEAVCEGRTDDDHLRSFIEKVPLPCDTPDKGAQTLN